MEGGSVGRNIGRFVCMCLRQLLVPGFFFFFFFFFFFVHYEIAMCTSSFPHSMQCIQLYRLHMLTCCLTPTSLLCSLVGT
jgi:hypothetical protein